LWVLQHHHLQVAVAQQLPRGAHAFLHRHGDAAVALIEEARFEPIEQQIDELARDLRRGVEAQRTGR
jgi:hypothetical protein